MNISRLVGLFRDKEREKERKREKERERDSETETDEQSVVTKLEPEHYRRHSALV